MSSRNTKTEPTPMEVAAFNFSIEVERARLLVEIANAAHGIAMEATDPTLPKEVRNAALQSLLVMLRPSMQIEQVAE